MDRIIQTLSNLLGTEEPTTRKILYTIGVIVGYVVVRQLAAYMVGRRVKDVARKYFASKTVTYLLGLVALIALLRIWLGGITNFGIGPVKRYDPFAPVNQRLAVAGTETNSVHGIAADANGWIWGAKPPNVVRLDAERYELELDDGHRVEGL